MKKNFYSFIRIAIFMGLYLSMENNSYAQHNPILGAGNGYVNITKKTTGGAVQKGDILELRTTYFFGPTYNISNKAANGNACKIFKVRYYDSVPVKTVMNVSPGDSLRLITNEGLTVQKYTLGWGDDAGTYSAAPGPGMYPIRINIGSGAADPGTSAGLLTDNTNAGSITIGTYVPKLFGGTLLTTAFRVTVTGNAGDTIVLGIGKLIYKKTSAGTDTVINATPYKILIDSTATALCPNSLGNNLAIEAHGSFDSGYTQNRSYGPAYLIPDYSFNPVSIATTTTDGSYAIVNNSSPGGSTNANAKMQPNCAAPSLTDSCTKRMHGGFWEIMGDHTGTNDAIGNPATPPGSKGGYMLMVNADVVTSEAYRQVVTGLCSDTYYEFSAWVKNICKRCAIDQNSINVYTVGVKPNLTFAINDLDIYSTGELDTTGWIKKGFVFKTGPAQTTAVISIRNNAPGGGGNDWVLDDLSLGTCGPTSTMNYKPIALGCSAGSTFTFTDTVRYSYNPKYSFYKWQRSTDGGATWTAPPQPIPNTGSVTIGAPVNGKYEYTSSFGPILVNSSDSGHLYRLIVGTNAANLSNSNCSFTDGSSIMVSVVQCPGVLEGSIISFSGKINYEGKAVLNWIVSNETNVLKYEIEKSADGTQFFKSGAQPSKNSAGFAEYYFTDEALAKSSNYFRLKIYRTSGSFKYSETILLNNNHNGIMIVGYSNPFTNAISLNYLLPANGKVKIIITDAMGKALYVQTLAGKKELNNFALNCLDFIAAGIYNITLYYDNTLVTKRLLKTD